MEIQVFLIFYGGFRPREVSRWIRTAFFIQIHTFRPQIHHSGPPQHQILGLGFRVCGYVLIYKLSQAPPEPTLGHPVAREGFGSMLERPWALKYDK